MQKLFVYGTLKPGEPNEHILRQIEGVFRPATIKGYLFMIGWGAAMGYPGLKLDEAGDDVSGYVFSSDEFDGFWPELDAFEGDEYERIIAHVTYEDGQRDQAYVYQAKMLEDWV